jgi:hypothetical protein
MDTDKLSIQATSISKLAFKAFWQLFALSHKHHRCEYGEEPVALLVAFMGESPTDLRR